MPATDISQFVRSAFDNTIEKSFGSGSVTNYDFLSPPVNGIWGAQSDDLQQVRGFNWTAILVKSLQFVQADVTVYCSKEIADMHREAYGDEESDHVTSASGGERMNVPKRFVVAPTTHRIARLMDSPNPWMDGTLFKCQISQQVDVHGGAVILVLPDENGKPNHLFVLPRALCWPIPPCSKYPEGGWRTGQLCRYFNSITPGKEPETMAEMMALWSNREVPARWVIPVGLPSLLWCDEFNNPTRMMADVLDADAQLHEARRKTFQNGSSGGARFTTDKGVTISRDQQEQILAEHQANAAGARNAGAAAFIPPGVSLSEPHTAKDMDYVEGSKEMRDSMLAQRGVMPAMVGLGDLSSYASVEATIAGQNILFAQPMMRIIGGQLEIGLKRYFQSPYDQFAIRIQANSIADPERKLKELELEIGAGTVTKGEIREHFGRRKWGDKRDEEIAGAAPEAAGAMPGAPAQDPLVALMGGQQKTPAAQQEATQEKQAAPEETQLAKCDVDEIKPLDPPCDCNCQKETPQSAVVAKAFGPSAQTQDLIYFRVPRTLLKVVRDWQQVVESSFGAEKVVDDIHCSVMYPVLDVAENAGQIAEVVEKHQAIDVRFGPLRVFRNADADVVVVEVLSDQLKVAKQSMQNEIACGISGHLVYRPHVTLAYCKPGTVPKSVDGQHCGGLTDQRWTVQELVLTDSGTEHVLPLDGSVGFESTGRRNRFAEALEAIGGFDGLMAKGFEGPEAEAERGDIAERSELIADILHSLYGSAALSLFADDEEADPTSLKAWDESRVIRHPKGKGRESGRFAPKNSAESVVAVHDQIKRALRGQRSAESAAELMRTLEGLTVQQLRELKQQYQMAASGRTKAELVEKIARRLDSGRRNPAFHQGVELSDEDSDGLEKEIRFLERNVNPNDEAGLARIDALKKVSSGQPLSKEEHQHAADYLQSTYNRSNSSDSVGAPVAPKRGKMADSVLTALGVDPQVKWKEQVGNRRGSEIPLMDKKGPDDPMAWKIDNRRGRNKPTEKPTETAGVTVPVSDNYDRDQIERRNLLNRAETALADGRLDRSKYDQLVELHEGKAAPKGWDKPEPAPKQEVTPPTPVVETPKPPEDKPVQKPAMDRAARARAEIEARKAETAGAEHDVKPPTFAERLGKQPIAGDDEPFQLQQPKKERKKEDFGVNQNSRQSALFDSGKPNELQGQNLLFNSDAGDLQNPNTMENKVRTQQTPAEAKRAEVLRRSPTVLREAIHERAAQTGHDPVALHQAVEEAWKIERQHHTERERMKQTAREYTGLTLTDVKAIENSNSDHDAVKRFDDGVKAMRDVYPELEHLDDANDFIWNLIREGSQPPKPKHHPDVLDAAESMLGGGGTSRTPSGGADDNEAADDFVPEEHRGWLNRSFNPDRVGKCRRFWLV